MMWYGVVLTIYTLQFIHLGWREYNFHLAYEKKYRKEELMCLRSSLYVPGYGIQFFFLAAFSWLNVICFDIWWTFGWVPTAFGGKVQYTDRKENNIGATQISFVQVWIYINFFKKTIWKLWNFDDLKLLLTNKLHV